MVGETMIEGQMNIFDFIQRPDDPIRNAIKHMSPYWTSSRKDIVNAYYSGKGFVEAVKHEYCPYGFAGHYGGDFGKRGVFTLIGWTLKPNKIVFEYDPYRVESITWKEFADHIADLIRKGEFLNDD